MSRRRKAEKREIISDPKFNDRVLSKFINIVMYDGKKSTAEKIVYKALDTAATKLKTKNNIDLFKSTDFLFFEFRCSAILSLCNSPPDNVDIDCPILR